MPINPFMKELTPRQLQFCLNYLSTEFKSAKDAMIAAGYDEEYSVRNSHNILKNTKIVSFLREEMQRRVKETCILNINFEAEALERAFEEIDPELKLKYAQEVRQWRKQREDAGHKIKELEIKIKELELKREELEARKNNEISNNEPIQIHIKEVK